MSKRDPVTQAVRVLRAAGAPFDGHPYDYAGGGTAEVAVALGVDEHLIVKTLILEDDRGRPLIMLMHGDLEVATGLLAKAMGAKRVQPCAPATAERHSGYRVGGTSPFGTRTAMPVYCERSVATLPRVYINGGKRGYIISLSSDDLLRVLTPDLVDAAQPGPTA
jgi:Cys-tRNA(Pro) deacylase